jgi:UDP-glucose 4-epimerase
MKPRVVLLGGSGFFGSHVADDLCAAGYTVRLVSTARRGWGNVAHLGAAVERVQADIGDPAAARAALAGCDAAVHLAGRGTPADVERTPADDETENLAPARRFLAAAAAVRLPRIVFASSGGTVYGRAERLPVDEDHPTVPLSAHGACKLALERTLGEAADRDGFDLAVLRFGNLYGERQDPGGRQGAVAVFLGAARDGRPIELSGGGAAVRDYLHAGDAARAIRLVIERRPDGRTFNVGSGVGLSVRELADEVERTTGRTLVRRTRPPLPGEVPASVLDASRLRRAVGWAPAIPLGEGLARTWRFMQEAGR